MTRRWSAGQAVSIPGGYTFRVVPGSKAADDLRLEWHTSAGWRPVPMAVAFVLVDFLAENERSLVGTGSWGNANAPGVTVGWRPNAA